MRKICCKHDMKITETSNVIQFDDMGYPLRLVIMTCSKCSKSEQTWIDVSEEGPNDVELKWRKK